MDPQIKGFLSPFTAPRSPFALTLPFAFFGLLDKNVKAGERRLPNMNVGLRLHLHRAGLTSRDAIYSHLPVFPR